MEKILKSSSRQNTTMSRWNPEWDEKSSKNNRHYERSKEFNEMTKHPYDYGTVNIPKGKFKATKPTDE